MVFNRKKIKHKEKFYTDGCLRLSLCISLVYLFFLKFIFYLPLSYIRMCNFIFQFIFFLSVRLFLLLHSIETDEERKKREKLTSCE